MLTLFLEQYDILQITNVPQQQIKRRTTLVPKHAVGNGEFRRDYKEID